jgi:hypothetical protein
MTPKDSITRQRLYVIQGVLSAYIAGIGSLDTSDWRITSAFFAGIILAGCNSMRAYLDGSVRDVQGPILPEGLPKPTQPPDVP